MCLVESIKTFAARCAKPAKWSGTATLAALALACAAEATEPRPQQCTWLRQRYTELFNQYQRGDESPQLQREMTRFRRDYHREQCEGDILL